MAQRLPNCTCPAYPFPHRPASSRCKKEQGWLQAAFEDGSDCDGCPHVHIFYESHGLPGPREKFVECLLLEGTKGEVKVADCMHWQRMIRRLNDGDQYIREAQEPNAP